MKEMKRLTAPGAKRAKRLAAAAAVGQEEAVGRRMAEAEAAAAAVVAAEVERSAAKQRRAKAAADTRIRKAEGAADLKLRGVMAEMEATAAETAAAHEAALRAVERQAEKLGLRNRELEREGVRMRAVEAAAKHSMRDSQALADRVGDATPAFMDCQLWTDIQHDGPDHLGLWLIRSGATPALRRTWPRRSRSSRPAHQTTALRPNTPPVAQNAAALQSQQPSEEEERPWRVDLPPRRLIVHPAIMDRPPTGLPQSPRVGLQCPNHLGAGGAMQARKNAELHATAVAEMAGLEAAVVEAERRNASAAGAHRRKAGGVASRQESRDRRAGRAEAGRQQGRERDRGASRSRAGQSSHAHDCPGGLLPCQCA